MVEVPKAAWSVDEFAQAFGFSRAFVYELLKQGKILSFKVGRCRRIPETERVEFVERLSVEKRDSTAPTRSSSAHGAKRNNG